MTTKSDLYAVDLTGATWSKSQRSGQGTGDCVEVSRILQDGAVIGFAVRDSKNPSRTALRFTPSEWAAFTGGVQDGEATLLP